MPVVCSIALFNGVKTQIDPRGDRVLVKVGEEETKTRGGILLPTSAIKKPTSGTLETR